MTTHSHRSSGPSPRRQASSAAIAPFARLTARIDEWERRTRTRRHADLLTRHAALTEELAAIDAELTATGAAQEAAQEGEPPC